MNPPVISLLRNRFLQSLLRRLCIKKIAAKFITVNGVTLAYREYGEGETLLLLHGNSESGKIFSKYQTEYFSRYHTFALDSRGHGKSGSEGGVLSIEQISDDVIAFCEAKTIAKARVIGYSDGGNVALFLAKKEPDRFVKIAAISPNYLVSGIVDSWLGVFKSAHAFFGLFGLGKQRLRFGLMLSDIGLSKEDLKSIRTGVEIVYASRDMIKEAHLIDIGESIPGARLAKITPSSHLSILKSKKAIEEMASFIK